MRCTSSSVWWTPAEWLRRNVPARTRRGAPVLVALCAGLALFCARAPVDDETVACVSSPVMGSNKIDTLFPAVGRIDGCTATLVGPNAILLAAHCLAAYAQGCRTKEETLRTLHFTLSPSGCLESIHRAGQDCAAESITYAVADLAIQPRAYDRSAVCPEVRCPSNGGAAPGVGLVPVFDVALARLVRRVAGARGASALPVVTSITDDERAPFTIHRRLDAQRFRAAVGCARPGGIVVGWGGNDLGAAIRVAGVTDFFDGPSWDQVCQPVRDCGDAGPASFCPLDHLAGAFQAQALRTHRGSSTPGAYDREFTWTGDSGGPLLVRGGTTADAVPELGAGAFVFGVLSVGDLDALPIPAGHDVNDLHAATFEPSNARFIEETLAMFASAPPDITAMEAPTRDGAR